jgi:isopentenyl-diphosphate delta-isomerase
MTDKEGSIQIPLVNATGAIVGYSEKMQVHRQGLLHLAFSLMITRTGSLGKEFLLQRRALDKYHSGGLWTNTCCSHPMKHESIAAAAQRRIKDEMGIIAALEMHNVAKIQYNHKLENGLYEHEYNHLLVAEVDDVVCTLNPEEVMDKRWWSSNDIKAGLLNTPQLFTVWFPEVFSHIYQHHIS